MTAKTDAPTARSIQIEWEVPGTPEQIWQAIATGPGITAWFTPTVVAEHEGGAVTFDLGPGAESRGTVTAWEPPRRFACARPGRRHARSAGGDGRRSAGARGDGRARGRTGDHA
jgi:uncharacterized protein YndB with AHSA1/START domain